MYVRIVEGTDTSHLDKVQHDYEKMEHFTTNFDCQRRALMNVDFIKRKKRLHPTVQSQTPKS